MKRTFLVFFVASAIVACAARSEIRGGDAGDDPNACTQSESCSGNEHSCKCATGNYCLIIGAECIDSTSPCPACR